jgi:hypothetical protein
MRPALKSAYRLILASALLLSSGRGVQAAPTEAELKAAFETYFADLFQRLGTVAGQKPTEATFRDLMQPQIGTIDGLFGATLINADWEIRQVYFKRDYLAVGFDLKKVDELRGFREQMTTDPAPQLSEPGRGGFMRPRLISLRYPILENGSMTGMVSLMIRTEAFLKQVKLDTCNAFTITCLGQETERKGTLGASPRLIQLALPSTEWVIAFD